MNMCPEMSSVQYRAIDSKGVKNMSNVERAYLPAAGHDWALPLYDPLVRLLGADRARRALLDQSDIPSGGRVLDIGCGTGTMAILIKQLHPKVDVVGLDPDPKALARARRKAGRSRASIQFDQGFSDSLPYPDAFFDRVFSSFMLHHLQAGEKEKTLREVRRVLTPGGSLHLLDFEEPETQTRGALARLFHSNHLKNNSQARILGLMSEAGFLYAKRVMERSMFFGGLRIGYFHASVPTSRTNVAF
jgi:ubiquinone/menaquinone biosynthesis C-methylase UbiE